MLKEIQDAYGHQLYDCFKGKRIVEVVERDDGFIGTSAIYPRHYLAPYKDWSPREKKAMQYARGQVLDIGCGGRLFMILVVPRILFSCNYFFLLTKMRPP